MEIIVGKTAGFCYGVQNAVSKAEEYVKTNNDRKTYCLGELVHNKQVTNELEEQGLEFIENVNDISSKGNNTTVIIRAHGEPKSTYEALHKKEITILDLTCPNVQSIHNVVEKHIKDDYYILLIGQKDHPEVIGTYGFCDGNCFVIENRDEIELAYEPLIKNEINKVLIVAQTTFSLQKFNEYVEEIKAWCNQNNIILDVKNTICNATKQRQEETENISKQVDFMIIIGGKNSSNTKKLFDISAKNCQKVVMIETYKDLENDIDTIITSNSIGIMAGASTPKKSITGVKEFINKICSQKIHGI